MGSIRPVFKKAYDITFHRAVYETGVYTKKDIRFSINFTYRLAFIPDRLKKK